MTLDLDAICGRLDGLTGGPWRAEFPEHLENGVVVADEGDMVVAEIHGYSADADFIAHAREDVVALLDAVTERNEQIAALQAVIEHARAQHFPHDWREPSDGSHGTVCGGPCEWITWPCPPALALAQAPTDALDGVKRGAAVWALEEAAQKWSWGQWADAPRRSDRVEERLANAQHVGDWLRARAAAIRAEGAL